MNKKDAIKLIDEKIADIKAAIAETKTSTEISKATRGTKLYALSRERRTIQLIRDLIAAGGDKVRLPDDSLSTFTLLTTLSSERVVRVGIEAVVGDDILDIARKYPNKSLAKITQQLRSKSMDVDEKTGKVIELKK